MDSLTHNGRVDIHDGMRERRMSDSEIVSDFNKISTSFKALHYPIARRVVHIDKQLIYW